MKKYALLIITILFFSFSAGVFALDFGAGAQDNPTFTAGASANPSSTGASTGGGCQKPTDFGTLFAYGTCLLSSGVVPFLVGLGLIIFLIGVVRFVGAGDNEEKREGGRNMMIFGIIALFVMVAVWGLVKILYTTFFDTAFELPSLPKTSTTPFQ